MGIADSVYDFSVRVAEIVRYLKEDGGGFPLCDKLLDCGVKAGISARGGNREAAADYVRQADYILEMAVKSGYLTERQSLPVRKECGELLAALTKEEKPRRESPDADAGPKNLQKRG